MSITFEPTPEPHSIDDVDRILAELREINAQRQALEAAHAKRLVAMDCEHQEQLRPLRNRAELLDASVLAWVQSNQAQLGGRSKKLAHGTLGMRTHPPAVTFAVSESDTVQRLKAKGLNHCIVLREVLDVKALKGLPAAERRLVGVQLVEKEEPFFRLN